MFLEEDLPKKKDAPEPRKLDRLSLDELQAHIEWLQSEIARAEDEIKHKEAAGHYAAQNFFKP